MALPKAHRLKHRHDFTALFRRGIRCATPHLTLRALRVSAYSEKGKQLSTPRVGLRPTVIPKKGEAENGKELNLDSAGTQPQPPTRIGISISQKVSKRAVIRNRIKRQLKAAFRQLLPKLSAGWILVIVVKPLATECDYQQFLQELEQLLVEAEVLNGHS